MRYAVLDVETTGLWSTDRLVEAAVVVLDNDPKPVDEFDTLIDPRRDVGPTRIHGITASMVSAAPVFEEIAGALASRLNGAVLVAHNLPFDVRMLNQEFARIGAELIGGSGFNTFTHTGCTLDAACASLGVPLHHHHRALADAHATAGLMRALYEQDERLAPSTVLNAPTPQATGSMRTLRHEAVQADLPPLLRIRPPLHFPTSDGQMLAYLHALNWVLDDAVIDHVERDELNSLSRDLGLDPIDTTAMHSHYLRELVRAAERDGIVTREERNLLDRVAAALGVDADFLPAITAVPLPPQLVDDLRVCFTGDAEPWTRDRLELAASEAGYRPVASVTRKACDLVVAADSASQSGKAAKARQYEIPIISVAEFLARIGGA